MKWLKLTLLLTILIGLVIGFPVRGDPPEPDIVYDWIGGSPVRTDNEHYQWTGGHPYGILKWIFAPTVTNGAGASNVDDDSAQLNGELITDGNSTTPVTAFWGTSDGGTTPASWSNNSSLGAQAVGTFSYNAGSLVDNTLYYYRMFAENSVGNDWANTSANFTTSIAPPTNLILTDMGAISVNATWTKSAGATYTMVRIKRNEAPSDTTDGELFYYGDNVTAAMSGFSFDVNEYVARAWSYASDNVTYSADYAEASIGGEGMTEVASAISNMSTSTLSLILVVLITGLAFWSNRPSLPQGQRSLFLLLLAVPVDLIYGLALSAGNTVASVEWVEGIIVAVIGTFCLIKAATDQVRNMTRSK